MFNEAAVKYRTLLVLVCLTAGPFASGCNSVRPSTPTPAKNCSCSMAIGKQAFAAKRYQAATEIFTTLAEQGDSEAQYTLGYMLYYGQGATQDQTVAVQWFERASKAGNSKAQKALNQIKQAKPQQ